ncbi:hypothetical protein [Oceanicoccus sp. KOV_DT_Chl]|uniref:hypothetical protein n=1 Tax=Oceanicoccus sp. KOV_DT_Chl TaxID=1904639 RepID=UPI0011AEF8C8|nr:hypothetical protein [Oceanicoccus sp. KOV_DT_Chl]
MKFFNGLILSLPASIFLLIIFQGKGTEPSAWLVLIIFALLGLPWNIALYLLFVTMGWALHYLFESIGFDDLASIIQFMDGYGLFIWSGYVAMVIACHINGAALNKVLFSGREKT